MRALTSLGRQVLVVGLLAAVAAAATGYGQLAAVAAAALLALLVGSPAGRRPPALTAAVTAPTQVPRGGPAAAEVLLVSSGRSPTAAFVLAVPYRQGERTGVSEVPVPRTGARQNRTLTVPLPTEHRGRIELDPVEFLRRDLLGLWRRGRSSGDPATVWVLPRVWPVPAATLRPAREQDDRSPVEAPDGGVAFTGLREYVPGDDLRRVHWTAGARLPGGPLLVRENAEPVTTVLTLVLDTRLAAYPGGDPAAAFEAAVEVAASALVAAADADLPATFVTTGAASVAGLGRRGNRAALLRVLAGITAETSNDPDDTLLPLDAHLQKAYRLGSQFGRHRGIGTVITGAGGTVAVPRHPVALVRISPAADTQSRIGRDRSMVTIDAGTAQAAVQSWCTALTRLPAGLS